ATSPIATRNKPARTIERRNGRLCQSALSARSVDMAQTYEATSLIAITSTCGSRADFSDTSRSLRTCRCVCGAAPGRYLPAKACEPTRPYQNGQCGAVVGSAGGVK